MAAHTSLDSPLNKNTKILLKDVAIKGEAFSRSEEGAREALIASARSLIMALETPMEAVTWMIWAEPTRNLASRLAIDLGIFEKLAADEGRAKSATELASVTGADPKLVSRVARHLATMGMINEAGVESYAPSALSSILTIPKHRDGIPFCFDCAGPVFQQLPAYLVSTGYKNPEDTMKGPFQYAHKTDLHAWEWLSERPKMMQAFQSYSSGYRLERPSWVDPGFYPIAERLTESLNRDGDSSALVDVGGGMGHDLEEFRIGHPEFKGRLVLQDQPQVIAQITGLNAGIEVTSHDFFTPQPVKGARAYYMHNILHDWPDDRCRLILQQLTKAMKPGYSKILIFENVIRDVGPSWQHTSLDLFMMALAAGQGRTEVQWRHLLHSVGLEIAGIWSKGTGNESLLEAVLDESLSGA